MKAAYALDAGIVRSMKRNKIHSPDYQPQLPLIE
jgi:hypothetical protein